MTAVKLCFEIKLGLLIYALYQSSEQYMGIFFIHQLRFDKGYISSGQVLVQVKDYGLFGDI